LYRIKENRSLNRKLDGCSKPFIFRRELTNWKVLAMSGSFLASCLPALLVLISVEIIVMHMLGSVLSVDGVSDSVETSIWDEFPTCF
jgi:hypothetical protein